MVLGEEAYWTGGEKRSSCPFPRQRKRKRIRDAGEVEAEVDGGRVETEDMAEAEGG